MRVLRLTWLWPLIILLSTLAVSLITFLFPGTVIRPFVIMAFLFIIPGMTLIRFFRTNESAVEWMLAIALSFTIDAFVAGIILYAGQWSPTHILSFLIGFCFSGAIAQLAIIRPTSPKHEPVSLHIKNANLKPDITDVKDFKAKIDTEDTEDEDTEIIEVKPAREMMEDPEDTKERPVVSLPSHQSFQHDSLEKTVLLKKPPFSNKEH